MGGVKESNYTKEVGNIELRENSVEVWQVGGDYGWLNGTVTHITYVHVHNT